MAAFAACIEALRPRLQVTAFPTTPAGPRAS
jgi:hypothetical protein